MNTQPRHRHHSSDHTFLGATANGCDIYSHIHEGERFVTSRRHSHPTKGYRTLSIVWVIILAGRGDKIWRNALRVANTSPVNDNAPALEDVALDNPDRMVVVRTHLRRFPGEA